MRKKGSCNITKDGSFITINYDPKASVEVKVDTLAECVSYLAKSILSLEERFNNRIYNHEDILNDLVEATANLIDDVEEIRYDIYE